MKVILIDETIYKIKNNDYNKINYISKKLDYYLNLDNKKYNELLELYDNEIHKIKNKYKPKFILDNKFVKMF